MALEATNLPGIEGLRFHTADKCEGEFCPIHNPSEHIMSDFRMNWRSDRGLMERICPHGVGHPDPDHMSWFLRIKGADATDSELIHGCDGCCDGAYDSVFREIHESQKEENQ